MFLFLVAVALVVVASLIFVFTKDWDEGADYPDEALQKEETAYRKRKTAIRREKKPSVRRKKKPSEIKESPTAEPPSPEKDWIEALITELPVENPEETPVQVKGKHEAQNAAPIELPKEPLKELSKQPPEEAPPLILPFEEKTIEAPKSAAVVKTGPEKKKENYGSLKPFSPKDEAPSWKEPSRLILVLEIICGLSAITAFITIAIAWGVVITHTGG